MAAYTKASSQGWLDAADLAKLKAEILKVHWETKTTGLIEQAFMVGANKTLADQIRKRMSFVLIDRLDDDVIVHLSLSPSPPTTIEYEPYLHRYLLMSRIDFSPELYADDVSDPNCIVCLDGIEVLRFHCYDAFSKPLLYPYIHISVHINSAFMEDHFQ